MNKLRNILNIPIPYVIVMAVSGIIIATLAFEGQLNVQSVIVTLSLTIIITLQIRFGWIVVKVIVSALIILYFTSMYTYLTINIEEYIIQPFLLTLASVTIFLAQTYGKTHNSALRSRPLWSTVLVSILVLIKSATLISGVGFWLTEVIGLNVLIIFIFSWRLWISNSKKTKIVEPIGGEEEIKGSYRFIYIQNELDAVNSKWKGKGFAKEENAYPYIYNEALRAYEDDLILVILSKSKTSELYDVGKIEINNSKTIPYLYLEAKEDIYVEEIIERFVNDISDMRIK